MMTSCDGQAICRDEKPLTGLEKLLRVLALATMLFTIPQAVAVWHANGAHGVSLVSWLSYLASTIAWLVYGIRKRDRMIWLECIGWLILDVIIIAGIVVNR